MAMMQIHLHSQESAIVLHTGVQFLNNMGMVMV